MKKWLKSRSLSIRFLDFQYSQQSQHSFAIAFDCFRLMLQAWRYVLLFFPFFIGVNYLALGLKKLVAVLHMSQNFFMYTFSVVGQNLLLTVFTFAVFVFLQFSVDRNPLTLKKLYSLIQNNLISFFMTFVLLYLVILAVSYLLLVPWLLPCLLLLLPLVFVPAIVLFFEHTPWQAIKLSFTVVKGSVFYLLNVLLVNYIVLLGLCFGVMQLLGWLFPLQHSFFAFITVAVVKYIAFINSCALALVVLNQLVLLNRFLNVAESND